MHGVGFMVREWLGCNIPSEDAVISDVICFTEQLLQVGGRLLTAWVSVGALGVWG